MRGSPAPEAPAEARPVAAAVAPATTRAEERLARRRSPGFRADVQGLRAVAVGLVVLAHAQVPGLVGGFVGVDVFFVISGFLITQGLVRELEARGRISLPGFWARRARRILPAATVTLLAVAAATFLLLPQTRWLQIGREVLSSATYVVNWHFADRAVDYMALGDAPSPLQHFWSLAVEEQFYLVWPPVVLLVAGLIRLARRAPSRRHLWLPVLVVLGASLAWSVHLTDADPAAAYLVTTTRGWELALGAALALLPAALVVRGRSAQALQWAGLAAIGYAATTYGATTPFPGSAALLPTLGAVAVLAGGLARTPRDQNTLLAARPMVWLGGLSYSLYLWHWPVLVIGAAVAEQQLRTSQALVLVALSLVPAWLSLRLVERPVLRARWLRRDDVRSLQLGVICVLVAVVAALGVQHGVPRAEGPSAAAGPVDAAVYPGAAALVSDPTDGAPVDSFPSITPTALQAPFDYQALDRPGCALDWPSGRPWRTDCTFGDPAAATRLVLIGDSHAEHLAPAVEEIARTQGWRLDVHTSSACPFVAASTDAVEPIPSDCEERNAALLAGLLADPPDAVLIGTSRYQVDTGDGRLSAADSRGLLAQGLREQWAPLVQAGVPVVAVRDVPRPGFNVPDCIATHPDQLSACAFDRASAVWDDDAPEVAAARSLPGARVLDLTPWICPGRRCPVVVGGIVVYRDTDHLTATYVRSLTGVIARPLLDALSR